MRFFEALNADSKTIERVLRNPKDLDLSDLKEYILQTWEKVKKKAREFNLEIPKLHISDEYNSQYLRIEGRVLDPVRPVILLDSKITLSLPFVARLILVNAYVIKKLRVVEPFIFDIETALLHEIVEYNLLKKGYPPVFAHALARKIENMFRVMKGLGCIV